MAKIIIAGDAVVVTSAFKLEDLKTIQKYRPKALTLMGGEDGKEPVFSVYASDGGEGSINELGAVFAAENRDKFATLTMVMHGVEADKAEEYVADKIGGAIINLNKLEATLNAVLAEIAEEKKTVLENITVAQ